MSLAEDSFETRSAVQPHFIVADTIETVTREFRHPAEHPSGQVSGSKENLSAIFKLCTTDLIVDSLPSYAAQADCGVSSSGPGYQNRYQCDDVARPPPLHWRCNVPCQSAFEARIYHRVNPYFTPTCSVLLYSYSPKWSITRTEFILFY